MPETKDTLKFIVLFGILFVFTKYTPINGWLMSLFNSSITIFVLLVLGSLVLTFGFEVIKQILLFFNR